MHTLDLPTLDRLLDLPLFTVGVDVFTCLSYYCHVTLIGFWGGGGFCQVHSTFATFVVNIL